MKHFLISTITVVIIGSLTLGFVSGKMRVSNKQGRQPQTTTSAVPAFKTEDLLKVRDLQYEQAKRLLEMKQIETRYRELQDATIQGQQQIDRPIREAALAAKIDLEKWDFNSDQLKFVERSKKESTKP